MFHDLSNFRWYYFCITSVNVHCELKSWNKDCILQDSDLLKILQIQQKVLEMKYKIHILHVFQVQNTFKYWKYLLLVLLWMFGVHIVQVCLLYSRFYGTCISNTPQQVCQHCCLIIAVVQLGCWLKVSLFACLQKAEFFRKREELGIKVPISGYAIFIADFASKNRGNYACATDLICEGLYSVSQKKHPGHF